MEFAYSLHGGAPIIKKYQVAASVSLAGIPHLIPAANGAGLVQATTTGAADVVGCNLDTATYATAQQSDGSDPAALVSVIINPDAVWEMALSGGATSGTALSARTVTSAATDGLSVTTGDDWSSPTMDEGSLWGYDGANAGVLRKITSVSSTAATVTVAFPQDTVVGDNFLYAPYNPFQTVTVQLTSDLTQANAAIAVGTGGSWRVIELIAKGLAESGKTKSAIRAIAGDHALIPTA